MSQRILILISSIVGLLIFFVIRTSGCGEEEALDLRVRNLGRATGPSTSMSKIPQKPKDHPEVSLSPEPAAQGTVLRGTVQKTINASRYTYIHLQDENGALIWAAVPQVTLQEGETISLIQSLMMKDFESKTLGRTFPSVVFGVLMRQSETLKSGDAGPHNKK